MSNFAGNFFVAFLWFASIIVSFFLIGMVVYIPALSFAERECLSKGYPKAYLTYNFERYCSTLDGAVTVKVERSN